MPNVWENCVKLHAGCGGVCRWVEAIDRPGVGYVGECCACGDTGLPREHMIPLEGYDAPDLLGVAPSDDLATLSWNDSDDWDTNQARLSDAVDDVLAGHTVES